jgi:putative ABC transport system ATP-binding protein
MSIATTIPTTADRSLEPVLNITKLNHSFGKGSLQKPVLYDIDLSIDPGEIVILTGLPGVAKLLY